MTSWGRVKGARKIADYLGVLKRKVIGSGEILKTVAWVCGVTSVSGALYHCIRSGMRLKSSEQRLRNLIDSAADAFFVHDTQGRIYEANRRACESLGYTREELMTLNVSDIEQSFSSNNIKKMWGSVVPGEAVTSEGVHQRKNGTTFPVEVRIGFLESNEQQLMFALVRDITERKKAEEALRKSERRFRQLFENSADALFVHDSEGHILDCNAEAVQSLGYEREKLLEMNVSDINVNMLTEEERRKKAENTLWKRVMRGEPGRIVGYDQGELRREDGTTFPVEVGVGAIEYGGGRAIFASVRDVTARKEMEKKLRQQALYDSLTYLPNRALFINRLEHLLKQAERQEKTVFVLFMDLDDFKSVNDNLGHEAGDQLLIAVARCLSSCIRAGDTAARLSGDEFTVLLENPGGVKEATLVAERILRALDTPFKVKGRQVRVTASIGITCTSDPQDTPTELLDRADEAMYEAKKHGGFRYKLYEPRTRAEST